MRVEWDDDKDLANQKKHGVSFEEAARLFRDEVDCLEIFDERHSDNEERFVSIGPVKRGLILVIWTERVEDVVQSSRQDGRPSTKQNFTERNLERNA